MAEEPESYQLMRSHADVHTFVVCYADRFYADVPYHVRIKGPWSGASRGDVAKLKPEPACGARRGALRSRPLPRGSVQSGDE